MKKCPYCAEDIQDAAIKCRYCGERVAVQAGGRNEEARPVLPETQPSPTAPPPSRDDAEMRPRCSQCGRPVSPATGACAHCSAPQPVASSPLMPPPPVGGEQPPGSLVTCTACGKAISCHANTCPGCGAPRPRPQREVTVSDRVGTGFLGPLYLLIKGWFKSAAVLTAMTVFLVLLGGPLAILGHIVVAFMLEKFLDMCEGYSFG